ILARITEALRQIHADLIPIEDLNRAPHRDLRTDGARERRFTGARQPGEPYDRTLHQSGTSCSVIEKFASVASPSLSFGIGNRQLDICAVMHSSTSLAKPDALPFTVRPVSLIVSDSVTLPRAVASFFRCSL